jgi:type I restriction enzyme M protein
MAREFKTTEEATKEGYVKDVTGEWLRATPEVLDAKIVFADRLVNEFGYTPEQIQTKPEFYIKKGSQKIGPADIVVFRDAKDKIQENIWIIVETKRKERSDGIDQLKTYLSPCKGAKWGVWFNGKDIAYLEVLDTPPYFREIYEVLKLIFIKMVDEKSVNPRCEFGISSEEEEEIREGKESTFTERILNLFERVKTQYSDVFEPYERINIKPITLAFIVGQLQDYNLIETPVDVKGIAFQTFVYAHQRGERGEFFTPYPILELAVKMLNPGDGEKFIDPACGSAGFLIRGMNHVKNEFIRQRPEMKERANEFVKDYARAYIAGIDINPDLAKVAKMHMVLYDDGHTGIFAANSLLPFNELVSIGEKAGVPRSLRPEQESFNVLMTNPPFGTRGRVTDKTILRQFELGYKWKKDKKTDKWEKTSTLQDGQVPDILFLERCLQLLKNGGRLAIVLPNGDLNNSTSEYIREYVKRNSRILAVVSLPVGTFMSAGSNPQPSVLFLQKLSEEEAEELNEKDYPIFMAIAEKIGYDLKTKTAPILYKKDVVGELIRDEKGKTIIDSDIPEIIEAFDKFKIKYNLRF